MRSFKLSFALIAALWVVLAAAPAAAIPVIKIGQWTGAPTAANDPTPPGANDGPGLATGQRYVLKIDYDPNVGVNTDVDILNGIFLPSGAKMDTIDLGAPGGVSNGNTLQVLVPMEGRDSPPPSSPFVYDQNQGDHFPVFIPNATLNFTAGSDRTDTANIIGVEFEGDFEPGAAFNVVEIFNTSPDGSTVNQVSQVLNCGDAGCSLGQPAIIGVNALTDAVDPTVDAGPNKVYNASTLTATTGASSAVNNNLGNNRSDGEDFLDFNWTQGGGALNGTPAGDPGNNNLIVAIADSGLTQTTSTAQWDVEVNEQLTGLGGATDSLQVSYANAIPTIANASATAVVGGINFDIAFGDLDLAVNALIGGFEVLLTELQVDSGVTSFFDGIFNSGASFFSDVALFGAFGAGVHNASLAVTDLAGAMANATFSFTVPDLGQPVPEPATLALFMLAVIVSVGHLRLQQSKGVRTHV